MTIIDSIKTHVKCWFNRVVLWAKHRGGFAYLGRYITVSGVVEAVDLAEDGDICFNLRVDPGFEWALEWNGAVHAVAPGCIHIEVSPCVPLQTELFAVVWDLVVRCRAGEKVHVEAKGPWCYDGVHSGKGIFFDILRVITGAPPKNDGWPRFTR